MKEKIDSLISSAKADVSACATVADIAAVKVRYLGKSGELTALLRGMKDVPADKKTGDRKIRQRGPRRHNRADGQKAEGTRGGADRGEDARRERRRHVFGA